MSRKEVPRAGLGQGGPGRQDHERGGRPRPAAERAAVQTAQGAASAARARAAWCIAAAAGRRPGGCPAAVRAQVVQAHDDDLCGLQRRAPHREAAGAPRAAGQPGDRAADAAGPRPRRPAPAPRAPASEPAPRAPGHGPTRAARCQPRSPGSKTAAPAPPCTASSTTPPRSRWPCGFAPPRICTATPPCWARPAAQYGVPVTLYGDRLESVPPQ